MPPHIAGSTYYMKDAKYARMEEWRYMLEHFILKLHRALLLDFLTDDSSIAVVGPGFRVQSEKHKYSPEAPAHFSGCLFAGRMMGGGESGLPKA